MVARKAKTELITGVDIGSTAIRLAVGQLSVDANGRRELQIVGAAQVPSVGVQKGVVTSIEEVISSIAHGLEQIERLIGVPIEHTWVGISGTGILAQGSRGVVSVAKADGEIAHEDTERAVEAAKIIAAPLNYEILHVIPQSYTVDGQPGIKDPVGMTGIRLEVDTKIIHGMSSHLKNVSKAVYRTGMDIDDIVLSVLATGDAVVTPKQKELGVAVVNIGGSTTSVVVYEGGDIIHTAVILIGSDHITNDIAIGLRTSIDVADRVKIEYGYCMAKGMPKKEKINLASVGGENEEVSRHYISEIIEARATEILDKVNTELQEVERSGLLPAGVVFTGGGAKLDGLVDLTKNYLGLPASLGYPIDVRSVSQASSDLAFTTAIGLVKWGSAIDGSPRSSKIRRRFPAPDTVWRQMQKIGNWLMP